MRCHLEAAVASGGQGGGSGVVGRTGKDHKRGSYRCKGDFDGGKGSSLGGGCGKSGGKKKRKSSKLGSKEGSVDRSERVKKDFLNLFDEKQVINHSYRFCFYILSNIMQGN